MELSDLTAYAEEKYHIKEEFKWSDLPGFSVLREPVSGKWVALLMRQWDSDIGMQIELCDLKCGEETLADAQFAPYLLAPFRMHGSKWAGLRFDKNTNTEMVFSLFDKAMQPETQQFLNFGLGDEPVSITKPFTETPLPSPAILPRLANSMIPAKILEMKQICRDEKSNSFSLKCKRFCLQGKFMEEYKDNLPWEEEFWCFLPTYHDLNLRQLRGFFTWRTYVRQGEFRHAPTPFAYLYIYELLNGIGAASPAEAFQKLEEFKDKYLDSGVKAEMLLSNLHRWLFEFAVINNLPVENALKYAQPDKLATDQALENLRKPDECTDKEVIAALRIFAPKTTSSSPLFCTTEDKGNHLFAQTWRLASKQFKKDGKDLFNLCFGKQTSRIWHPFSTAIYLEQSKPEIIEYVLNDHHRFNYNNGIWQEWYYPTTAFDFDRIKAFLHETDRQLRKYLKTGSPLREKKEEAWATPFVEAVIEDDKQAVAEAARPQITIDLSGLAQIRHDALITQNSLLTDEDRQEEDAPVEATALVRAQRARCAEPPCNAAPAPPQSVRLDELQCALLHLLLEGESAKELLRKHHLMPSIVMDAINEALFDEIGDNVLECEDDTISIVEDYRDDITRLLGDNTI